MSSRQDQHRAYFIQLIIPGLQEPERSLLAQAQCLIEGDTVAFHDLRRREHNDEHITRQANRWIAREVSRVNVLSRRLLMAQDLWTEPPIGVDIRAPTGWDNQAQVPDLHCGWSDDSVEFRISTWDVARHSNEPAMRSVMLDTICESARVAREWIDKYRLPPRFAEARLNRNLLGHGSEKPNEDLTTYLCLCHPSIPNNKLSNREAHLNLARMRSALLIEAVWKTVINDITEIEHDLKEHEPAS